MFIRVQDGVIIILLIYVDDILVACNNLEVVSKFKTFLHDQFKLKDLGSLKYWGWKWQGLAKVLAYTRGNMF